MKFLILFVVLVASVYGAPDVGGFFADEETIDGLQKPEERIAGGTPVPLGRLPYFALILSTIGQSGVQCGGTLIARDWILTAGHCVYNSSLSTEAYMGIVQRTAQPIYSSGVINRNQIYVHPRFSIDNSVPRVYNDIALLKLNNPPNLSSNIGTIGVLSSGLNLVGRVGTAMGFGYSGALPILSNTLDAVNLTVVARSNCDLYNDNGRDWFSNEHFCTGNPGARSVCGGDGGGPFVVNVNGTDTVVGIVSITFAECAQGYPAIFLGVDSYFPWINGTMDGTWKDSAPKSIAVSVILLIGSILASFFAK